MDYAGQVSIRNIPPTVSVIGIRYGEQHDINPIFTSLFDCMHHNRLEGDIELRTLPPRIEIVDLKCNDIIGPIDIRFVPKTLQRLDLSQNRLFQNVVSHGDLSLCMQFIDYRGSFVKKVLPERPQYKESARNIEIHV